MSDRELSGASGGAPCNICGVNWPHHATACAYVANVRDLYKARDELTRVCASVIAAAGNPDAAEGCRQVIRIAKEATDA